MTVIPFPVSAALQRAILQPSIHARGARTYAFAGEIDPWHAPGVLVKQGITRCAVDAAWLVEPVLGSPRTRPMIWPGVPGVRDRAIAMGKSAGLYTFQQEGAAFLAERDYALLVDEMGCLESGARVSVAFGAAPTFTEMTIRELYYRWKGSPDLFQPARIVVNAGNGREVELVAHEIDDVLYRGRKPVIRIETGARSLCGTPDHEFFLASGAEYPISRLRVGDRLMTVNGPEVIAHLGDAGSTDVYDIVCKDPFRNFVASGFVVHNCGKTGQALVAAESRLSLAHVPDPDQPVVLVLCPALAKRHWQREIKKWTGHEAEVLDSLTPGELPHTRYVIANYDILYGARRKDAAGVVHDVEHLPGWSGVLAGQFLIVVADEAHVFRGRVSRRTTTVKKLAARIPVMWGLTGTPIPNYVRDLWSTLDLLSGGLWGSYWDFSKKYADAAQAQYGWKNTGSSNLDELRGRATFFMLGRSTASVKMELPEKRREIFRIDVQVSAPTVHEGVKALNKSGLVARALRITATAKRSAVVSQIVEALEANQKVGVGVYMREQADAIAKAVKERVDCPVFCVHGDLSPDGRDAQATVFRECSSPAAFICTIDSVGIAISLVGADLVLLGDLVPEPWKLLQFEKRWHRHGSTKRVIVRYLIGTGTLDEGVAETVIEKLASIEEALGTEADQQELSGMLGGGAKTEESIIDGLFARLKALGGAE